MGGVVKSVTKAVSDVGNAVGSVAKEVTKPARNLVQGVGNTIEANKEGINATVGSAVRIGAAMATGGKSEMLGVGDYVTKQFGGGSMKAIGQIGGNIAGAAKGDMSSVSGILKSTAKQYAGNAIKGALTGGRQMVATAQPQNYVMQNSQGKQGQNMSFLSDLGDLAIDYGKNQLMGGAKDRKISAPAPQPMKQYTPPAVITAPAAPQQPMISKNMMIAGGALAGLAVLAVVLKK